MWSTRRRRGPRPRGSLGRGRGGDPAPSARRERSSTGVRPPPRREPQLRPAGRPGLPSALLLAPPACRPDRKPTPGSGGDAKASGRVSTRPGLTTGGGAAPGGWQAARWTAGEITAGHDTTYDETTTKQGECAQGRAGGARKEAHCASTKAVQAQRRSQSQGARDGGTRTARRTQRNLLRPPRPGKGGRVSRPCPPFFHPWAGKGRTPPPAGGQAGRRLPPRRPPPVPGSRLGGG